MFVVAALTLIEGVASAAPLRSTAAVDLGRSFALGVAPDPRATTHHQVAEEADPAADMIDAAELAEPERAARFPDPLHAHVDIYWSDRFAEAGRPYRSPGGVVGFSTVIETGCGLADPVKETAFYCILDETIYYSVEFREIIEANIGDYGWVVVVAHEWGHHIQQQLGYDVAMLPYQAGGIPSIALEQQADCLAGAYTDAAELSGWLHPGDVDEAITMTELSGDPPEMGDRHPTAHGSGAERVAAFVEGYEEGLAGCELELEGSGTG